MLNIPLTMKAWQKHFGSTDPNLMVSQNQVQVEVPVPSTPENGLLVKILAAGVCHSDISLLNMKKPPQLYYKERFTLGHEGCGEIVQVGSQVDSLAFKVGDLVAINAVAGCGDSKCEECSRGLEQICSAGEHYGIGSDGSYAEYIAILARAAVPLPKGVLPEVGAVSTDAVMTAYHAVMCRAKVKKDETVLIFGLGGLGFNALQIVLWIGARVIIVDARQEVLDEAVKFGVSKEDVVLPGESAADFVVSKNIVVDTVIDFVGVPNTFSMAQNIVRLGGMIVLVGLLAPEVTVHSFTAVRKHLTIACSYGGTYRDLQQVLELIAKKVIVPQVVIADLAEFPQVLQDLHAGKVKSRIVLVPNHNQPSTGKAQL